MLTVLISSEFRQSNANALGLAVLRDRLRDELGVELGDLAALNNILLGLGHICGWLSRWPAIALLFRSLAVALSVTNVGK